MMKRTRALTVVFAALMPVLLLSAANGCGKKDDDEKPIASAAPAPSPAPSAPTTVTPEEDAGTAAPDAGDAAPDVKKPQGGGGGGSIAKCCAALQQNANNAPLDQKASYITAAAMCNGMRSNPSAQQAFAQLRMALQGAKMPAACQ